MNAGQKFLGLLTLLIAAALVWSTSTLAAVILICTFVVIVFVTGRGAGHW